MRSGGGTASLAEEVAKKAARRSERPSKAVLDAGGKAQPPAAEAAQPAAPTPAASPRRHSPRAYEAQLLARGGQPRWPTCAYPPSPDDDDRTEQNRAGVPVGAYVCDRADAVQKVRAALKGTGRLKRDGVTRFDARVWDACRGDDANGGANRGSEDPHPPSAASWAVHAFAPLDPGSELPELLALAASGEATFVRNVRLGHPACYVDWDPDDGAAERGDDADRPLGTRTPTITTDEARRVIRERRDEEAFARARRGRGQSGAGSGGSSLQGGVILHSTVVRPRADASLPTMPPCPDFRPAHTLLKPPPRCSISRSRHADVLATRCCTFTVLLARHPPLHYTHTHSGLTDTRR